MNVWTIIMIFFLMANILMLSLNLMKEFGLFQNDLIKTKFAFLIMEIDLLFKKRIVVKPHLEYYSSYQATEHFYLMKIYKCSHERFFKLVSGSYTTIVPEHGIIELDGKPFKPKS